MSDIELKIAAPTAEIILNRPEKRNAVSSAMWRAIPDMVATAISDTSVKVIIIHGGESKAFASGADVSEFPTLYASPESAAAANAVIGRAVSALSSCPKPVIASIDGACVGGGVSLALASDLRFAGPTAKFGITPAKLGLIYPPLDTRLLISTVGISSAKDLLFTGRIVSAEEASGMGLIDRLCSSDQPTLQAAKDYAELITAGSQWSVRAITAMIRGIENGWTEDSEAAKELFLEGFGGEDFTEGYKAFLEKRPPHFTFQ